MVESFCNIGGSENRFSACCPELGSPQGQYERLLYWLAWDSLSGENSKRNLQLLQGTSF